MASLPPKSGSVKKSYRINFFLLSMYSVFPCDRIMSYTRWKAVRVTLGFFRTRSRYSSKVPSQCCSEYDRRSCRAAMRDTQLPLEVPVSAMCSSSRSQHNPWTTGAHARPPPPERRAGPGAGLARVSGDSPPLPEPLHLPLLDGGGMAARVPAEDVRAVVPGDEVEVLAVVGVE